MWELDHEEGWALKNWCFWTVVLEKTLGSPLDCKIKVVNLKGNKSWIFIGRTDAEAELANIWPPDAKGQLSGKDPDAGKERRQRWWRTGKPGVLQSIGTQRVRHIEQLNNNNKTSQVKELSAFFMCVGRVWVHWNHSFDMHLSYIWPLFCVFTPWALLEFTMGSGCCLMAAVCVQSLSRVTPWTVAHQAPLSMWIYWQ